MGLCHDIGSGVRVGAGAGIDAVDQDLLLGGTLTGDGYHLVGEVDVRPAGTPLLFSLTGYFADWNLKLNRTYANGSGIDLSRGRTAARSWAVRGRIDWRDLLRTGALGVSPYAAFTYSRVTIDAYTEQGGGFPVQMNRATAQTNELRLGAVAALPLGSRVNFRASGEWVGRLDRSATALTGSILGATAFSVNAPLARKNWGRLGADLDLQLGRAALLTFSMHSMLGGGEDARVAGSVGLRFSF
jgi:outer membrane autotransporter protein